jgi:hypothetical protein
MKRPDTEAKMMEEKERRGVAVGSVAPPTHIKLQMEEGRRGGGRREEGVVVGLRAHCCGGGWLD